MKSRLVLPAALACTALAACGQGGITADTTCKDYLGYAEDQRHDAAVRLSSELGASSPGNPMWGLSLDGACGAAPSMTIRDYFQR